ncbi:MAG TPA: glycosyltransferase, partial [Bacillota bacterium]|nr:glycosyltransferase [Bacillota bacterium]
MIIPVNAQFIDTFFPNIDGVVRTVHNYALNMNKSTYSCVVAPEQDKSYKDAFPYDVYRIRSLRLPSYEYRLPVMITANGLGQVLQSKRFQIFHAHSPFFVGHYALRESKRLGIPLVTTFHSKYYDDVYKITHSKVIAKQTVNIIVDFYSKCDSVWTVGEGTANTLRDYGYKGEIFVIDNGSDVSYPDNADELRDKVTEIYNIPSGCPVLLFVGHQIWQKNIKTVLDALRLLTDSNFNYCM